MSLVQSFTPCYDGGLASSYFIADMFDFLFKRPSATPATPATPAPETPAASGITREQEKQAALAQAASLAHDEALATEFILHCPFADARLVAAEQVQGKAAMEQVLQAMRNTDRRVAKLMQQRLQALAHQAHLQQQWQACLDSAEKLLQDPHLTPNQVAELDRNRQLAGSPGADGDTDLRTAFDAARAQLAERLQQQLALQRNIRDQLAALRQLASHGAAADGAPLSEQLAQLTQQNQQWQNEREIHSVPKHLLSEFEQALQQLQQQASQLEQQQQNHQARQQLLQQWQAQDPATLVAADLKRHWHSLPALAEPHRADFAERFEALLASIVPAAAAASAATAVIDMGAAPATPTSASAHTPPERPKHEAQRSKADPAETQQFTAALDGLEQALAQGSLHAAAEFDKTMRDLKNVKPARDQAQRMANARNELHRLQGWAKWGGNVSREELIKSVEELPQQKLAIAELAQKVGSMRERWKKLDAASGAAPKPLWERFDQACTSAYAPAAAHFKKLAEERTQNLHQAEALLVQIGQFNESFDANMDAQQANWKQVAGFVQRQHQAWHQLGPIERKDKKRLDAEFERLMAHSAQPLAEQRAQEVARREQLIAEVQACDPQQRHTLDHLRQLQERWQEQAKALPLERKPEQALWQRFRQACDAVFAARKESAQAADSERRGHLQQKEALCAELDGAASLDLAEQTRLLKSTLERWQHIGSVPRAQETAIEQRFQAARQGLQQKIEAAKRQARHAEQHHLLARLHLCQELEALRHAGPDTVVAEQEWRDRWHSATPVAKELETVLTTRFDAALLANANWRNQVSRQSDEFLADLLRMEIELGLESPPELAQQRLKAQVAVLQSSLHSGQKPRPPQTLLRQLCAQAVLLNPADAKRLDKILTHLHT
jgi:hypothetical protein